MKTKGTSLENGGDSGQGEHQSPADVVGIDEGEEGAAGIGHDEPAGDHELVCLFPYKMDWHLVDGDKSTANVGHGSFGYI